jgi:uncharacterized protein YbaP (TraB family)
MLLLSAFYGKSQLLWEISGKGAKTSYIFGTNHLAPASFLDSIPKIYKAFNSTQVVVGEVLMSAENISDTIMQHAAMPQNILLKSLFSEEDYALINDAVQKTLFLNLSDIARLKPAMITLMYEQAIYEKLFPKKESFQIDSYFQQVAELQSKPVFGLETAVQQSTLLFGNQTLERQAQLLAAAVKDSASTIDEIRAVVKLYEKQDIYGLYSLFVSDTSATAPTAQEKSSLLDDRNALWAEKITKIIKKQSAFIAVGALHLPAENGLLNLLQKKGFKVKAVQ